MIELLSPLAVGVEPPPEENISVYNCWVPIREAPLSGPGLELEIARREGEHSCGLSGETSPEKPQ